MNDAGFKCFEIDFLIKKKRHDPDSAERSERGAKNKRFLRMFKSGVRKLKEMEKEKTPRPGFEPGNPCGNKISSLAEYQIVPSWHY